MREELNSLRPREAALQASLCARALENLDLRRQLQAAKQASEPSVVQVGPCPTSLLSCVLCGCQVVFFEGTGGQNVFCVRLMATVLCVTCLCPPHLYALCVCILLCLVSGMKDVFLCVCITASMLSCQSRGGWGCILTLWLPVRCRLGGAIIGQGQHAPFGQLHA